MDFVRLPTCPVCENRGQRRWAEKNPYHLAQCRRCGFVFVNPRPTLASLTEYYATLALMDAARDGAPPSAAAANPVGIGLGLLPPRDSPLRYLDVGAGYGDDLLRAAAAGCEVLAIEPGRKAAAVCARRTGIEPRTESFEDTVLPDQGFDLIMANQVLEHVFDPDAWFGRFFRLLAPAGVLCVSLPNFDSLFRYLMGRDDPFITPPGHLNFFNRRTLALLAARHALFPIRTDYRTEFSDRTINKRVIPVLKPVALAVRRPFGRSLDRAGLGVTLTLYFRAPAAG